MLRCMCSWAVRSMPAHASNPVRRQRGAQSLDDDAAGAEICCRTVACGCQSHWHRIVVLAVGDGLKCHRLIRLLRFQGDLDDGPSGCVKPENLEPGTELPLPAHHRKQSNT